MIKLLITIKSKLLCESLCKQLEGIDDIQVIKTENFKEEPDIIVIDLNNLTEDLLTKYPNSKILLIDMGNSKEDILCNLVRYKLKGVFSHDSNIEQFIKAIKVINQGQVWLNNSLVQSLINRGFIDNNKIGKVKLTEKESEIIQYVCEGLSNKEIGKKMYISEQTVKAHLHKIFQKMHVKNRSQLIKLYIYNSR